jgi:HK97 family phage prohead protease
MSEYRNVKGLERRFIQQVEIETRSDGDVKTISGHAAIYGASSGNNLPFIESCNFGCFDRSIADDSNDCLALIDHNPERILGRRKNGSLTLRSDRVGLAFNVKLPSTTYVADLLQNIRAGNIRGCSFGFTVRKQTWGRNGNNERTRSLEDVDLHDISVVASPVYTSTDVSSDEFNSLKTFDDFDESDESEDSDSDSGRMARMIQQVARVNFPGGVGEEIRSAFAEKLYKRELERGQSARVRRSRLNAVLHF